MFMRSFRDAIRRYIGICDILCTMQQSTALYRDCRYLCHQSARRDLCARDVSQACSGEGEACN